MADRAVFLVDGFNLYHSILDAARDFNGLSAKWLDLHALCSSFLHLLGKDSRLGCIYYFSAFAEHLNDPSVVARHKAYIRCLEATGIRVTMSRFKPKSIRCPHCNQEIVRYEEKETDVAIAAKIFEVILDNEADTLVLVTGDTDLAPAVKVAKRLFTDKRILFAFPYRRKNAELAAIAPGSFKIHKNSYIRHQFPDPVILSDGTLIHKPANW